MQHTGHIDAAAENFFSLEHVARYAFSCQGTRIQAGRTRDDDAVNRHFFTGLHDDNRTDFDFVRVYLFQFAIGFDIGIIGPNIHQFADVAAAFADGIALEQFTNLVKEHNGNRFRIIAVFIDSQCQGPHRRHGHEKIFVKHLTVANPLHGFAQYIIADNAVGNDIGCQPFPAADRKQINDTQQDTCHDNAYQRFLLFLVHDSAFFLFI